MKMQFTLQTDGANWENPKWFSPFCPKKKILEVISRVQERCFAADLPERRRQSDLGRPFRDNVPNNSRIQVSAAGRQMWGK